jgi:hypothetical protein
MKLPGLSVFSWTATDESQQDAPLRRERRRAPRADCAGLKLIARQRRQLGIIHLRNLSTDGACGITDLPVAVDSIIFLELKKALFYAARVKWTRNFTVGLELARSMPPTTFEELVGRTATPN